MGEEGGAGGRADRGGRKQQHEATGGGPFLQPVRDHTCQDSTCNRQRVRSWCLGMSSPEEKESQQQK
jgi:hypothetical protein